MEKQAYKLVLDTVLKEKGTDIAYVRGANMSVEYLILGSKKYLNLFFRCNELFKPIY